MDKGIRPACNAKFAELNVQRKAGELTNTAFRKSVMAYIMDQFGITLASAATHYNHSFLSMKKEAPAEVEGLGRPDDKKGGRKPKPKTDAAETPAVVAEPAAPVVRYFTVVKAKDGTEVAKDLTEEEANALIAKAVAGKKAKLAIKE